MKESGASFSTRPTSWSEHNLPPDVFNENVFDWCCLLGSQLRLTWHCWVGQELWVLSTDWSIWFLSGGDLGYTLGLWAVVLPASPWAQSAPTNHMPRALHSRLSVFKSQFAWSLDRARRAIKATAVQFPTENFLPISECVCIYVFKKKKKKKNILVLCTKHFWGRYGAL